MAEFMNFPMAREHVLSSGDTIVGVIPELSLVSHFQVGSWQVFYRPMETGNVTRWGMPLMIPNFSRLKNGIFVEKGTTLPIHGFGRTLPWTTLAQDDHSISIQLTSNDATRPHYPYEFAFTATIAVAPGTLSYTLTMENRSDEVMPIAPGWHPYFAIPQGDKARVIVDGLPELNPASIQWDTRPPDTPYPFPYRVTVQVPRTGSFTVAEQPIGDRYVLTTMQVWSEPVLVPDHAFICFEPVVTSEDGLNRPADRLNIAPHGSQQIVLHVSAQPA
jgi:galactose mutarotase-like enzyme